MSIFPQPIQDKSLVNWDIRGARAGYIEKEVKNYERQQMSPPIPQKQPEDYVINTRHGPNPNIKRAQQPNLEVQMPQGNGPFLDLSGKRHFGYKQGEIQLKRSLENPYNLPQNYDFIQPSYPRNLNVQDIDGTLAGSLANKVVKNKEQAQKIIYQDKNELNQIRDLQKNPYNKYQDALDKFKNEMNGGSQGEFRDRHHYIEDSDNPYAPIDHPKYNQAKQKNEFDKQNNTYDSIIEKNKFISNNSSKYDENYKQSYEDGSYKPRQLRDDLRAKDDNYQKQDILEYQRRDKKETESEIKEQEQREYERYLEYLREKENEKANQIKYEQLKQSYAQENDYVKQEIEKNMKDDYTIANRQPSPIDYQRKGQISSYKSQPNFLKLNHQSEIISHTMNNISPQITKQHLGPNLNLEGYIALGKGSRLNPTSMSYVGTELANKKFQLGHNLLGNQIIFKEKSEQLQKRDPLRFTHSELNLEKFEKYPGEFTDILKKQGKPPTKENLYLLQCERAHAPKSVMDQIIKHHVNVNDRRLGNLDHFKKDTGLIPQYRELPPDYLNMGQVDNPYQQWEEQGQLKTQQTFIPYGAPFSYHPNEHKKKEMVTFNQSQQFYNKYQQMNNTDRQSDIQKGSPEHQQHHTNKTQNEDEEEQQRIRKMEYQKYLKSNPHKENFAGLGSYEHQLNSKAQDSKNSGSMEYIEKFGARGLRNLSNVRIF